MGKVKLLARVDFGLGPGKVNRIEAGSEFEVDESLAHVLVSRGFALNDNDKENKEMEKEKELKSEAKTKELKATVKTKEAKPSLKSKNKAK